MTEDISEVIAAVLGVERSSIAIETAREDVNNWDSLNHLRIISALEEKFQIRFTMDEIQSIASVGDVVRFLNAHRDDH